MDEHQVSVMKLSVVMLAYNQGKYIEQAIRSVFAQNMNFSWELIIGDDCSTDTTEEVVKKLNIELNEKITYIKHSQNIGLHRNYVHCVQQAKGEYIAFLEADDFWMDASKNQKQIELMESDSSIAWSFTNGIIVNESKEIIQEVNKVYPSSFSMEYYLEHFFNPLSNTIIVRKSCEPIDYPAFFYQVRQWDTALNYIRLLGEKKVGYVPVVGLAWRRHENATSVSIQFSGEQRYKDWLLINREMLKLVPENLKYFFSNNYPAYEKIALTSFFSRKYIKFLYYIWKMLIQHPIQFRRQIRDFMWKIRNKQL